jgi:hypothetical protein
MNLRLTRRTFLGAVLTAAASTVLGWRWWRSRHHAGLSAEVLQALLPHRESAALLGRHYLAATPHEADAQRLRALLAGSLEAVAAKPETLHRRVHEQIRDDFTAARVVAVDGWLLSLTEARLCALVSLGSAGHGTGT